MQATAMAAVAAAPRAGALAPAGPRRRQLVRPCVRCSATVSEEKASAQGQAAGGGPAGGGNGALAGAAAPASQQLPQPPKLPVNQTVCMEGFGWDSHKTKPWYSTVASKIPELKASGITHLWLPPPSQSVSPEGYLPGQLYNLNSQYGSEAELRDLNCKLREAGIRPVADIVINHRCADKQDENGVWNKYGDDVDHNGRPINWDKWAITSDDPKFRGTGGKDSGDDYDAAPDLDHHNPQLRESLVDWLNWLRDDIGFEGWRFDFIRGYAPEYCREYCEKTLGADTFYVGEYFVDVQWNGSNLDYNQDAARQRLCDYIKRAEFTTLFDFPTKGILQEAVKNCEYDRLRDGRGKAPGLLGWWPEKACTFVDNHDTGSTQQHWPFPNKHVMLGYAYILTHPGIPCLFWEHYFDWGLAKEIDKLVALRQRAGIQADSKLEILDAEKDMYVARINGNVTVKLGPRYEMGSFVPRKEDGWVLAASGKDFAVWEKK